MLGFMVGLVVLFVVGIGFALKAIYDAIMKCIRDRKERKEPRERLHLAPIGDSWA
jgi:hypothetical protein